MVVPIAHYTQSMMNALSIKGVAYCSFEHILLGTARSRLANAARCLGVKIVTITEWKHRRIKARVLFLGSGEITSGLTRLSSLFGLDTFQRVEFLFGVHSNIPLCCSIYFALSVRSYCDGDKIDKDLRPTKLVGVNYSQCPKCDRLLRKGQIQPNKIHDCDETCEVILRIIGLDEEEIMLFSSHNR